MTAKEAQEIATKSIVDSLKVVFIKIKRASENGDFIVNIEKDLNNEQFKYLKSIGYKIYYNKENEKSVTTISWSL